MSQNSSTSRKRSRRTPTFADEYFGQKAKGIVPRSYCRDCNGCSEGTYPPGLDITCVNLCFTPRNGVSSQRKDTAANVIVSDSAIASRRRYRDSDASACGT